MSENLGQMCFSFVLNATPFLTVFYVQSSFHTLAEMEGAVGLPGEKRDAMRHAHKCLFYIVSEYVHQFEEVWKTQSQRVVGLHTFLDQNKKTALKAKKNEEGRIEFVPHTVDSLMKWIKNTLTKHAIKPLRGGSGIDRLDKFFHDWVDVVEPTYYHEVVDAFESDQGMQVERRLPRPSVAPSKGSAKKPQPTLDDGCDVPATEPLMPPRTGYKRLNKSQSNVAVSQDKTTKKRTRWQRELGDLDQYDFILNDVSIANQSIDCTLSPHEALVLRRILSENDHV